MSYFDLTTERCAECDGHWRHISGCSDYTADVAKNPNFYPEAFCRECGEDETTAGKLVQIDLSRNEWFCYGCMNNAGDMED